jgi:hypothetical protein
MIIDTDELAENVIAAYMNKIDDVSKASQEDGSDPYFAIKTLIGTQNIILSDIDNIEDLAERYLPKGNDDR